MTELKHLIGEYWALSVPEDGKDFTIIQKQVSWLFYNLDSAATSHRKKLPPGSWSIISTSDEITAVQADKIVGKIKAPLCVIYKDYTGQSDFKGNPLHSFQSLLKSHGLEGRQLIIKKEL